MPVNTRAHARTAVACVCERAPLLVFLMRPLLFFSPSLCFPLPLFVSSSPAKSDYLGLFYVFLPKRLSTLLPSRDVPLFFFLLFSNMQPHHWLDPWLSPLSTRRTNSKLVCSNSPNLLQATVRLPCKKIRQPLRHQQDCRLEFFYRSPVSTTFSLCDEPTNADRIVFNSLMLATPFLFHRHNMLCM